jgi:tetratricopeptide (TPR) repeat protein
VSRPDDLLELARRDGGAGGDLEPEQVAAAVESFAAAGDSASAQELIGRLWRVWFSRGLIDEGSRVAGRALAVPGGESAAVWRARALYADGVFAFRAGDQERSRRRNQEALRLAEAGGDVRGQCDALTGLARVALRDGSYAEVVALARQARQRAQEVGDREAEASPLHLEAAGTRLLGDYAAARDLYRESLRLNTELGAAPWVAMEQHNLGWVELHLGRIDEAEHRFRERDNHIGEDAYGEAWRHLNRAAIALARHDHAEAWRRFAEGKHALDQLRMTLDPDDQSEFDYLQHELEKAAGRPESPPGG